LNIEVKQVKLAAIKRLDNVLPIVIYLQLKEV